MPATVEELERVQALVQRLLPIGAAAPGVVISADDWNVLVGAVVEIARALVETGHTEVAAHDHHDQVGLAWLDARVRALLEQGPLGEPSAQARLQDLEHSRARLDERFGALGETLGALRTETRDVKTRDVAREQSVNAVRRKMEGVADTRDDVSALRSSLDGLGGRIDAAVALGRLLRSEDGTPVDVVALAGRLTEVEKLRDQLRFPSGEDFDAALLDQRLAALRAEVVTEEELQDAIGDLDGKREAQVQEISDRLGGQIDSRVEARGKELEERIGAIADERAGRLGERLPSLVADAVAPIAERVRADAADVAAAIAAKAVAEADARLDTRLGALGETLRGESAAAVDDLRGTLDVTVATQLDAILPGRLDEVRRQVAVAEERLGALDGSLGALRDELGGVDARIVELQRGAEAQAADLRAEVGSVAGRLQALADDAANAVELVRKLEDSFDDRAGRLASDLVERRMEGVREELGRMVEDELTGVEDKIIWRVQEQIGEGVEKRVLARMREQMVSVANDVYDRRQRPR